MATKQAWAAVLIFSTYIVGTTFCKNILLIPLSGQGSHYFGMLFIAKELLHREHNITMLVAGRHVDDITFSQNPTERSIHYIFFPSQLTMDEYFDFFANMTTAGLKGRFFEFVIEMATKGNALKSKLERECTDLLTNRKILSALRDSNFELILSDSNQGACPIHQFLGKNMAIPYVTLSSYLTVESILASRSPFNPSYMPRIYSGLDDKMSYLDRFKNFATSLLLFGLASFGMFGSFRNLRSEHGLPRANCEGAEMLLINTNFALDYPRSLLPNTRTVGGLTTRKGRPLSTVSITYCLLFPYGRVI